MPHGTTRDELRIVWQARPELRDAVALMASQITTTEKEQA